MESKSSGLIPISRRDIRDFNHELQFGAADLSQLPPLGLGRKPISIKDQRSTQFCPAYSTATASEYIEGIEMSPEYQAAVIGEIAGAPIFNGASFKNALKGLTLFGSLPQKDAPLTLDKDGEKVVADLKNWPRGLAQKADDYLKASSYDVLRGSYDAFDNIKSALAKAKEDGEDRVALVASQWYENWNGHKIHRKGIGSFSWHLHLIIDWTRINGEEVLVGQNSYGKNWGDRGLCYWSREAINQLAADSRNEAKMVRDLTPETAKEAQWGLAITIYDMLVKKDPTGAIKWLVEFLASWLLDWKPAPPTVPPQVPPAPEPVKIQWDTREHIKAACQTICDEESLNAEQKQTLVATIEGESQFKLAAKNENKNDKGQVLSTDWGICQINDYYHIGAGKSFPSVDFVLNNPGACVRWMCKQWKAGNRNWWIAYKNGSYKKYL